jgi:hypothetical protein
VKYEEGFRQVARPSQFLRDAKPINVPKSRIRQHEMRSALIIVTVSLSRFWEGTQKHVSKANANVPTTSQFASRLATLRDSPENAVPKPRIVTTSVGGTRNERTAATANPRQTLVGIIRGLYTTKYWQTLASLKRSDCRFHSLSGPRCLGVHCGSLLPEAPHPDPLPIRWGEGEIPGHVIPG